MINKKIKINEIKFTYKPYNNSLLESIKARGICLPVKVNEENDSYICIDGHKRLSVLQDLNIDYVVVMINNDFSKAGSSFWGNTRNKH